MSDFLTRLAERAQGRVTLARPGIAPRFAKGPDLPEPGPAPLPPETARPALPGLPELEEDPAVWRRLLEQPLEVPGPAGSPAPPGPPGTVRLLAPRPGPRVPRVASRVAAPPPAAEREPDAPRPCPSLQSYLRRPRGGAL